MVKSKYKIFSAYGWQLTNNQSNAPELNSANVSANGILTSSISFSATDLVELYYTPEKKNTRRGRGRRNSESQKQKKEINNPILKSIFKNLYNFSDKFSKINMSYSYKVNNSHSNILADDEFYPDLAYRLALTDNPHSDNALYNNENN